MKVKTVSKENFISWIEEAIEGENFIKYDIIPSGKLDSTEGYVGDIQFMTVIGTTKNGDEKKMHLVIKYSKSNENIRKAINMKSVFEGEVYFYDVALPMFQQLQLDRNIQDGFAAVPKFYKSIFQENQEAIILNNIKELGYELRDRLKPLNTHHLKAVLREYGKLHALSFALKAQKPEKYNYLTNNCINCFTDFLDSKHARDAYRSAITNALQLLEKNNEMRLVEKFRKLMGENGSDTVLRLLTESDPQNVIIHGDGWSNNFMFKYDDSDRTSPAKVTILDWQLSAARSPAIDLSYLIYNGGSTEEFARFNELMDEYYSALSEFLRQLGSDPEEIFPYSALREHWRKYSVYGILMAPYILVFIMSSKEQAPAYEDMKDGQNMAEVLISADNEAYYQRMRAALVHYFEHKF